MNGLPYYKAYPRDFIEGTVKMPFEVKCAYRVLIDLIYMHGGLLPDDPRYIAGQLGCSVRKWNSIRDKLVRADKVQVSGEFLANYRADKELESLAKLQDIQRQNAAGPRKNKGLRKPRQSHTESEPYIPPIPPKGGGEDDLFSLHVGWWHRTGKPPLNLKNPTAVAERFVSEGIATRDELRAAFWPGLDSKVIEAPKLRAVK